MKATVVGINLDAQMNGKSFVEFTTQGDPYNGQPKKPRVHRLFRPYANEMITIIESLKVGDRVEYRTDDSQYKNMNYLCKIVEPDIPTGGTSSKSGSHLLCYRHKCPVCAEEDPKTQVRIARAAAMKEATQLVLFGAKKTDDIDVLTTKVMDVTRTLEHFLNMKEWDAETEFPEPDESPFK